MSKFRIFCLFQTISIVGLTETPKWTCYDRDMCIESEVNLSEGGGFVCASFSREVRCKNHFANGCLHEMPGIKIYYKMFNSRECKASQKLIESIYPK